MSRSLTLGGELISASYLLTRQRGVGMTEWGGDQFTPHDQFAAWVSQQPSRVVARIEIGMRTPSTILAASA